MTPEETLDWLAQQHFDQCREERPIQDWIRKMKSQLPVQPAAVVEPHMSEQHKQRSVSEHLEPVEDLQAKLKWATEQLEANINWEFVAAAKEEMLKAAWAEIKELREQIKEPAVAEQHKQEPLEYWNAVEGWVKIDEVREHFDSVGCATIYKTAGEGRVPLSLCKAQPAVSETHKQEPVAWMSEHRFDELRQGFTVMTTLTKQRAFEDDIALYTTPPQRKPLTDEQLLNAYLKANGLEFYKSFARAIEAAHGIRPTDFKEKNNGS